MARARGHTDSVCARGSGHSDDVWVVICPTFDSITGRQEGIKALNESGVTIEKCRDTLNDSGCIDAISVTVSETHSVNTLG